MVDTQERGGKGRFSWPKTALFLAGVIVLLRIVAEIYRFRSDAAAGESTLDGVLNVVTPIAVIGVVIFFLVWLGARRISSRFAKLNLIDPQSLHLRGIFSAEMVGALRRISPEIADLAATLGSPFGIIANHEGLGMWKVGPDPKRLFTIAWPDITSIEPTEVSGPSRSFPALLIRVTTADGSASVPVWLSSERRYGLFPQNASEAQATIASLRHLTPSS